VCLKTGSRVKNELRTTDIEKITSADDAFPQRMLNTEVVEY
jgi:hypothetical protein